LNYQHIQIFQEVDPGRLEPILALGRLLQVADGHRLIEAGCDNHVLYLLLRGKMVARLPGAADHQGMPIEPGETIGEMSILDGQKTTAHVDAVGACEVLAVDEDVFWRDWATLPDVLRNLTRLVTQRMRANTDQICRSLREQMKLELLIKELSSARDIQMGLLPHRQPLFPDHPQVEVHAKLIPAKEVGGDLYDAFVLDEEHVLMAVGDVSGKGMPAALFMMRTLTLLRSEGVAARSPERLLPTLNALLCEGNEANMFVTLCLMILSTRTGQATLFNAGHPPVLLSRVGGPFESLTEAKGAILGVMPGLSFRSQTLTLGPGDRLLMYSDGVTEAENHRQEMFALGRAQKVLNECPAELPMSGLVERLIDDVTVFADGTEQSDDITLLALRFHGL